MSYQDLSLDRASGLNNGCNARSVPLGPDARENRSVRHCPNPLPSKQRDRQAQLDVWVVSEADSLPTHTVEMEGRPSGVKC